MEQFEIFDRDGASLGICARDEVHRLGHWHKSTHVFLFHLDGRLLLQRRADDKDLYASLWDYSVAEHLQPGETFLQGAQRGVAEEMGVIDLPLEILGGLSHQELTGPGYIDREIRQAFIGEVDGALNPDPIEVAEVRFAQLSEIRDWVVRNGEDFTPWFVQDMREFGYI